MGTRSIIGSYKKPKNAAELARAILYAIEEDFNLDVDRSEEWFQLMGWGGRFEVDTKWGVATVVVQSEMRRGDCWEEIDGKRRQLIYAWERAGSPEPAAVVWAPAPEPDPIEFRPVKAYNTPRTRREFAESVAAFAQVELGMLVEYFGEEGDDEPPWLKVAFSGLDAEVDGVSLAMPATHEGDVVGVVGDGEKELLAAYRARLKADSIESADELPAGWTVDFLTPTEAKALAEFREGKDSALKPKRKRDAKVGEAFNPATN